MSSASPAVFSDSGRDPDRSAHRRRSRRKHTPANARQSVYEWTILALAALAPLLGVWLFGGVRLWSIGPLMSAVFLATVLAALRFLRLPRERAAVHVPPGFFPLACFVAYGFLLVPWAAVPYDALVEALKVSSFLCAYWVWFQLSGSHGRWRWLVALFLIVVSAMAWYAIIQNAQHARGVLNLIRPMDYGMRASGAYFCPNHFANLLNLTIPFAFAVAAAPAAGLPLRLLAGYTVLVSLSPLYLTQSRSGWIGVLVGLAVTISLLGLRRSFRRFLRLLIAAPLVLGLVGVMVWMVSPMVQDRIAQALEGNIRLQLWHDTWLMISQRPWFGWGPYAYRWVYPHFWQYMTTYLDPQYAHNDYLHTWAEYGLVGLALLVGAILWAAIRLARLIRVSEPDRSACLIAGLLGSLAATAAHAAFDYNFHIYGNVQVLVLLAGVVTAVVYASNPEPVQPKYPWLPRAVAVAALIPLLLLGLSIRAVATYGYALRGDFAREVFRMEDAQADYEKALRIHPGYWSAHLGLGHTWGAQAFWNRDEEVRRDQLERAHAAYARSRELNPWDTDALFGISRLYNVQGQPERALETLQKVIDQVPHHREFLNQLGLQLRRMGRDQEALETFQRARTYGPTEIADRNIESLTRKLNPPDAAP